MNIATNNDMNLLLDKIVNRLCEYYSQDQAESLTIEYYLKFTDPAFCSSIGIPVQDEDFMHHESAGGMALRVHYYLGLGSDPSPHAFIEWRSNLDTRHAPRGDGNCR